MVGDRPERSAAHLEHAAGLLTGDSYRAYSDLAAARLVSGSEDADPERFIAALDAAERALEQRPGYLPALYNRATALEKLLLLEPARDAWTAYGQVETEGGWRSEAFEHLKVLDDLVPNRSDLANDRDAFLREGVGALVVSECSSKPFLDSFSRVIKTGEHWLTETRDPFFLDAARWMGQYFCDAAAESQARAAGEAFLAAMAAYDRRDTAAANLLREARSKLRSLSSPLQWVASVYETIAIRRLAAEQDVDRYAREAHAMARLNSLSLEETSYTWLSARSHWSSGTALYRMADLAGSNREYRQALDQLVQASDLRNASLVASLLAEGLLEVGRTQEAWMQAHEALRNASLVGDPYQKYVVLEQLCLMTLATGYQRAGLALQDEALAAARETNNPYFTSDALRVLAVVLAGVDKPDEALQRLEEARSEAASVSDETLRERALASIDLAEGDLEGAVGPSERIAALTSAVRSYTGKLSHAPYAALARVLRARSYFEAGDLVSSERDLEEAIRFVEDYGSGLSDQTERVAIFDQFKIYDRLLELLVDDYSSQEKALLVAERERFAAYSRGESRHSPSAADMDQLLLNLGDREGILVIRQVEERWFAWCLGGGEVVLALDTSAADLNWALQVLRRPPRDDNDSLWLMASTAVYDRLFRPLAWFLEGKETLTIVPGRYLANLPFAGLIDADTSAYLGERLLVRTAPSLFLTAQRPRRPADDESTAYLVVGDPALGPEFPQLEPLPAAREEALIVERWLRGQGDVLLGTDATEARFLEHIRTARVTHFAGHALVDPHQPWRSSLLMSPGQEDDGLLTAEEILGRSIGSSLVVLSACDSALTSADGASAAGLGLTLPFLINGVPDVVGVMAPLEDSVGMRFFDLFYEELAQTDSAAMALHRAQMRALAMKDLGAKAFYFSLNSLIETPKENV